MQYRTGHTIHREDVSHKTMIREMFEKGLPPPFRVGFITASMLILVACNAIVQPAVVKCQRNVILDIEGAISILSSDAG